MLSLINRDPLSKAPQNEYPTRLQSKTSRQRLVLNLAELKPVSTQVPGTGPAHA